MFFWTEAFNHHPDGWTIAALTYMSGMFYSAKGFNQPPEGWNIAAVLDMSYKFNTTIGTAWKNETTDANTLDVTNGTAQRVMDDGRGAALVEGRI